MIAYANVQERWAYGDLKKLLNDFILAAIVWRVFRLSVHMISSAAFRTAILCLVGAMSLHSQLK
jgi:hypothetical protein